MEMFELTILNHTEASSQRFIIFLLFYSIDQKPTTKISFYVYERVMPTFNLKVYAIPSNLQGSVMYIFSTKVSFHQVVLETSRILLYK